MKVKKPLNAFMQYMKIQRLNRSTDFQAKEAPIVNKILGNEWKNMTVAEKMPYKELSKKDWKNYHLQVSKTPQLASGTKGISLIICDCKTFFFEKRKNKRIDSNVLFNAQKTLASVKLKNGAPNVGKISE